MGNANSPAPPILAGDSSEIGLHAYKLIIYGELCLTSFFVQVENSFNMHLYCNVTPNNINA